ncbi:Zinc metalloproteinase nas-6-like protein [Leptotrombidium deliense]|uniref:Zinc metalloproteinase nas-6-like protein n=1 Tax=Leptotrombidium deliense TaxID=299467 RepID=A0A443SHB6_9ACAR|nr:Zinc metalloproteinase nas-6-like protein [Leptotrombidium deliense]
MPKTAAEAYKMQLNDQWYTVGPTRYVTPMFRNNKFVVRYYILGKPREPGGISITDFTPKSTPITVDDIKGAHAEIEYYACIEFTSIAPNSNGDFYTPVKFPVIVYNFYEYDCSVKYGRIGRYSGRNIISIGSCIKEYKRDLLRAIMQVLGFIQEHRRGDRDSYVNFHSYAVEKQYWPLYEKLNYKFAPNIDMLEEPFCYDYYSIMHFGSLEHKRAFKERVIDRRRRHTANVVLEPLCKFDETKMGGHELSDRDQRRLKILYACEKLQPVIDNVILLPEGRNAFYYDKASGYTPWGYRKDITHRRPDPI